MALLDTGKGKLHYQLDGAEGAPLLVLSNSLGTTMDMWLPQLPALSNISACCDMTRAATVSPRSRPGRTRSLSLAVTCSRCSIT